MAHKGYAWLDEMLSNPEYIERSVRPRLMSGLAASTEGCHVWQKRISTAGYGELSVLGASRSVHVLAYVLLVGDFDRDLELNHLCWNRACANPAHLEPVTTIENARYTLYSHGQLMAAKTHCPQGHEYTEENTILKLQKKTGGPNRVCRTCKREFQRARRAEKKDNR